MYKDGMSRNERTTYSHVNAAAFSITGTSTHGYVHCNPYHGTSSNASNADSHGRTEIDLYTSTHGYIDSFYGSAHPTDTNTAIWWFSLNTQDY